ncbi:lysylphosphatidylglycerol synthase transmembrane domain-containing protein [Kaistia granuli]|uniref:lysylphosphatidylglycerol synthase transmembrane domain-containing protein n=1 Tax=Kaistia granuli TaxID=363259 RepID=UPI00037090E0|nr:YbhN family protein [Kaistia granuli]
MKVRNAAWSIFGIGAVAVSVFILYQEFRRISFAEVADSLRAITLGNWGLAICATLVAYGALAWYDRIAIQHLGKKVSWLFIALCSFTTYALSHNIGASVISGAVVRYRAYSTRGLTPQEIGLLIVFCSFTFALGTVLMGGFVLTIEPEIVLRLADIPIWISFALGLVLLGLVGLYVLGSWRHFPAWQYKRFTLQYPRLPIVMRQLVAGPLELAAAAAIIYFALPAAGNPGYLVILGIFLASFTLALLSHAPGGLGVLEVTFLAALHEMDPNDVLAALIVFRLLYLLVPFAIALVVVLLFERTQLARKDTE